jgi:hypothetical protein
MANTAAKVIDIALAEVGYFEKRTNAQLDSKTANAGYNNWNKYARDLDKIPNFYNGKKNGYHWCDVFVDWCFFKAFGEDAARKLLCQPEKSYGAGCTWSAKYYKQKGQLHSDPIKGDQIFFGNKKTHDCTHTGIVYKVDETYVYTVEGNTSGGSGIVANGGCVAKKKYKLTDGGIYGYGRPKYDKEEAPKQPAKKSVTQIAQEVLEGRWGNGDDRKLALWAAGYDYKAVQAEVNRLTSCRKSVTQIAREVINGEWGNGTVRKQKLQAAGYDYSEVQREVNRLLS